MPLSEWRKYKLSDVIEIVGGGTPKTSCPDYWDGNISWLSVVDFNSDNRWVNTTEKTITELGLQKSSTKILNKGEIIISARGTVGALAQLSKNMAFNQSCYGIKAKNKAINDFIYYLLRFHINELKSKTHGSVFNTITRETFDYIEINLPPLPEQKAIAEILGSLDDKIELNRKMNKTLEEMAQAIFKSWFVDFDPVKAKAEGRTIEGLSQEIFDLFPDSFEESELGDVPKGWKVHKLEDILEITSSKRIFMSDYVESGIPFYRSKEVIEKQKGNNVSTELFITIDKYNDIKKKFSVPKVGDILLTSVGTLGVSYLVKNSDEFYFKDGNLTWFKNYTKTFPEIIYYWLRSSGGQFELEKITIGSTQKALTIASMKKINIILPPMELQKELNNTLKVIRNNIDFNLEHIQTLSTLRDSLLPKLISGEIRVSDAKKILEGVL